MTVLPLGPLTGQNEAVEDREEPPPLVRWAFRWNLPIPLRWRPWGIDQVEAKWGSPSDGDRDLVIPAPIAPFGVEGRIGRRSFRRRKEDELWVLGLRPDGSARLLEHMHPSDPIRAIERLPERCWPWVPLCLTLFAVAVVLATAAFAMWIG